MTFSYQLEILVSLSVLFPQPLFVWLFSPVFCYDVCSGLQVIYEGQLNNSRSDLMLWYDLYITLNFLPNTLALTSSLRIQVDPFWQWVFFLLVCCVCNLLSKINMLKEHLYVKFCSRIHKSAAEIHKSQKAYSNYTMNIISILGGFSIQRWLNFISWW